MEQDNRRLLYRQFQERFPIESLDKMSLSEYTNLNKNDSFCYWLEFKCEELGSVSGGSSYKFGIYRYGNIPKNESLVQYDEQYAWYKKYNKTSAKDAYKLIRESICTIAYCAKNNRYEEIDNIDTFGDVIKWKIAFLYSEEKLIPIYKYEMLVFVAEAMGLDNASDMSIASLQRFLIKEKGEKDLYEYYDELLAILDDRQEYRNKETNKRYWWLVANSSIWDMRTTWKEGYSEDFTLYNENGRRRRLPKNFDNARAGDIVIGYETVNGKYKNIYASSMVVALGIVEKASDGEVVWFKCEKQLQNPVYLSLNDLKQNPYLKDMEYVRNFHGTLFKVEESEYRYLMNMIRENNPGFDCDDVDIEIKEDLSSKYVAKNTYSKQDFLAEVYMSEDNYDSLRCLLEKKKNVILQGVPGVGKTFAAKRLAYSIMGEKDNDRIEFIQFHQNYSYEDFMMGYKPTEEGGFVLKEGVFYNFCQKARGDIEHDYFFIIDEINRGNLSKIFGEVMMLMENDYRDESVKLVYRDELFSIPRNVYIIGMMNTADRSLAMMDYALRRRFSFFEMQPAFESEGFRKYQEKLDCKAFDDVIGGIVDLNKKIADDDSLGKGFCIGHSYFCNQDVVDIKWLRNVIKYDIEPMLCEYWFDDDNKYQSEIENLNKLF